MRPILVDNNGCVANLKVCKSLLGKQLAMLMLLVVVMIFSGCSNRSSESTDETSIDSSLSSSENQEADTEADEEITLTIMAAASLTEMFTEVESKYEAEHPNVDLVFSFAGSQALATQIVEGVNADVFASANTKYMDNLIDEGMVLSDDAQTFAKNKLAIIVSKDISEIITYEDIVSGDYKIVIADETVPVGKYTLTFLEQVEQSLPGFTSAFNDHVVSKETNVKLVASKVELGEADLGIVYMTDLTSANQDLLTIVEIPDEVNVIATYPISKLADSENAEASSEFVSFMLSEEGKSVLQKHGFTVDH